MGRLAWLDEAEPLAHCFQNYMLTESGPTDKQVLPRIACDEEMELCVVTDYIPRLAKLEPWQADAPCART